MLRTQSGRTVLEAADAGQINLRLAWRTAPEGLYGRVPVTIAGDVPEATVFLRNNQNGRVYDILGRRANGYQTVAGTATQEGLHALGVGGSRRAEALVRLAELEQLGVPIDHRAMRQVLSDMRRTVDDTGISVYSNLPWRRGGTALGVDS